MNKIRWLLPSNENYVLTNIVRMPGTSKMELFVKIVYNWEKWTSVAKTQFFYKIIFFKIIFQLSQRFVCRINGYWIELDFCQIKNDFLPNTIVIRENLGPLPWSKMELFVTIFWEILRGIGSKTMNRSTLLWNKSYEHGEQIQIPQIHSCTNFNSFLADVSIFYPLKISESLWFFGVFRGYKNGNIGQKWVKEIDGNNFNLLMIANRVHVFNTFSVSFSLLSLTLSYSPVGIVLIAKSSVIDSLKILWYSRYCLVSIRQSKFGIYIRNHLS